jgi:hypothetical protein
MNLCIVNTRCSAKARDTIKKDWRENIKDSDWKTACFTLL